MRVFFLVNGPLYSPDGEKCYANTVGMDYLSRYLKISSNLVLGTNNILIGICEGKSELVTEQPSKLSVKNLHFSAKYLKLIPNICHVISVIRYEIENSDFFVIRCPNFLSLYAIRLANKLKKPYLVELVGCPWDTYRSHSRIGILFAPLMFIFTYYSIYNARNVIYVTEKFLQRRYPTKGNQLSCSNVVLKNIDNNVLGIRKRKIMSINKENSIVLGTIGSVDVKYKGQEYVIKAISKLIIEGFKFSYWIVGSGDQSRLKEIAREWNVSDSVLFIGSLEHGKIFSFLDTIDIYIHPSKTEGLPRAMIEAMSRGCPCIGSNVGGIHELIDSEYMFKPGKVDEIASILSMINTNQLIIQSEKNYVRSNDFLYEKLEQKRDIFIRDALKTF